jgi:nucleotide-binding universal stress UspA family protein
VIKSILACLDGSDRAPGVFDMAAEIAERFGAKLRLFRVVTLPQEIPPAAHVSHGDPLQAYLASTAIEELARMALRAPRVQIEPPMVRDGLPAWRQILASSDELDVDLIVIGSHGYHGIDYLLGTTAARVVNLARRPVLVVHDRISP